MLHRIASEIKDSLTGLSFADKVEGLARTVKKTINGEEKIFPIYYETDPTTCKPSKLQDLVPDTKKKSIIYFEVVSQPTVVNAHKAYNEYEAVLRLVCWVNYDKINQAYYEPSLLISEILKDMPTKITDTMVKGVNITFLEQADKDTLFSAFTYPEAEKHPTTYPLDAFGLDFDVQYRISNNCIADATIDASCRY